MNHTTNRSTRTAKMQEASKGQAILIVAVTMVVLLGFAALAIDGGELYFLQRKAQNAVDAAIVAGVYQLCAHKPVPEDTSWNPNTAGNGWEIPSAAFTAGSNLTFDTRQYNAVVDAQDAAEMNGFNNDRVTNWVYVETPYPISGGSDDQILVRVTANKDARLVQLVYRGPLQVQAEGVGSCDKGGTWTEGKAMYGIGECYGNEAAITFSGSNFTIDGGIFSNGDADVNPGGGSNEGTVNGGAGAVGSVDGHNKVTFTPASQGGQTTQTPPTIWDIDDFKPGGRFADAAGSAYHDVSLGWPSGTATPGIYYSSGALNIPNNKLPDPPSKFTFVAVGPIDTGNNSNGLWTPYQQSVASGYALYPMPLLFSNYGNSTCTTSTSDAAIKTSAGGFDFLGVIYAPFGMVKMSFPGVSTSNGAIIAFQMNLSGSSFHLVFDPDLLPPTGPTGGVIR